ncbi:MAG: serine hydrolase [Acidobacteria bacterium]|nr:serine hydrolase [Acidobacteriota bacterium]
MSCTPAYALVQQLLAAKRTRFGTHAAQTIDRLVHHAVVLEVEVPTNADVERLLDAARALVGCGRAREIVRSAVLEQNLPGVSVAVGAGSSVVWAEGFGWRDVVTRAPVTPDTRFNIGTAASAVTAAVAPLGLTHTGTDSAAEWSPEHVATDLRSSFAGVVQTGRHCDR